MVALASLRREWTAEADGPQALTDAEFDGAFADWWIDERERRTIWLAGRDAEWIGMINLLEYHRMPRPGRAASAWGYVGNAYVRSVERGRGVGASLLDAVITEARRRGHQHLLVNPTERAARFYARAGFRPHTGLLALDLATERV